MIRPLTGQVLVRVLPPEDKTTSGIFLPDISADSPRGEKAKPFKAIVLEIGPWPKTKNGFSILPPIRRGQVVICSPYSGTKLTRNIGERLQLVRSSDILAIVD